MVFVPGHSSSSPSSSSSSFMTSNFSSDDSEYEEKDKQENFNFKTNNTRKRQEIHDVSESESESECFEDPSDFYDTDTEEEEEIYGKRKMKKSIRSQIGKNKKKSKFSVIKKRKGKRTTSTRSKDKKLFNAGVVSDEDDESSGNGSSDFDSEYDSENKFSFKRNQKRPQVPSGIIEFMTKEEMMTGPQFRELDLLGDWNEERNEFLVKWKGLSWRWAQWLPAEATELLTINSRRKVENFIKKIEAEKEDFYSCDGAAASSSVLETNRYNFEVNWREIERIVAMQPTRDGGNYYLCKWKALGYGECTWEWEGDVREWKGQGAIDKFLSFHQYKAKSKISQSTTSASAYKAVKFRKYAQQPDFLPKELSLRDYQLEGLNWLLFSWSRRVNVILADEMGLGKTIQSVAFLATLKEDYSFVGPSLVVVPLSTIDAWQREFSRWAPGLNVIVYVGDATSRAVARHYEFDNFDILLTTYELVLKDQKLLAEKKWRLLMVDEGHRLKNSSSQLYDALFSLVPQGGRVLITGTPLQNSLGELYCLLRFLMPDKFYDYDEFLALYSVDFKEQSSTANLTNAESSNKNCNGNSNKSRLNELHGLIKPHILRRLKRDVEHSLPGKTEKIIRVDLSPLQKQLYRYILTRNYKDLKRTQEAAGNRATGSLLNILGELKKVCNHPMLLGTGSPALQEAQTSDNVTWSVEESGKMALLRRLLRRLKDDGHRVLIFSQSVKMLDILQNFIRSEGYESQRLDGSTASTARHMAITAFNAEDSKDFIFLLSTRAGGLGINLATADTVIIYDSDWNPQNDLQAMARAHRIGQKRVVRIFRLVSAGTVEEEILERAKKKMVLDHLVIQQLKKTRKTESESSSDVQAILKFGAKALFESDAPAIPASAIDLDALLSEDPVGAQQKNEEQENNSVTGTVEGDDGEFLSQFRMADLGTAVNWDEIIPEEERKKAEEEERRLSELAKEVELQEALLTAAAGRRSKPSLNSAMMISPTTKKSQIKIVELPNDSALVLFKSSDESALKAYDALSHFGVFDEDSTWEARLIGRLNEILKSHTSVNVPVPSHFRVIRGSPLQKASITGLIDRIAGLKILRHTLESFLKRNPWLNGEQLQLTLRDFEQFRHPLLGIKAPQAWPFLSYSIQQDSLLLAAVGIFGYGNWQRIRQELSESSGSQWLKLQGPQITRRVDYLLKELVANLSKLTLIEQNEPGKVKEHGIEDPASISDLNADELLIAKFKRPFKPIRHVLIALEELKGRVQSLNSKEVGSRLTGHLRQLGDFIDAHEALRSDPQVWEFIGAFWPFQMGSMGPELKHLYSSLQQRHQ